MISMYYFTFDFKWNLVQPTKEQRIYEQQLLNKYAFINLQLFLEKGDYYGLPTKSEDLSVFVLFLLIIFLLSYFSLPPPASRDFSMKFGMLIVLDEPNRLDIFSSQ